MSTDAPLDHHSLVPFPLDRGAQGLTAAEIERMCLAFIRLITAPEGAIPDEHGRHNHRKDNHYTR